MASPLQGTIGGRQGSNGRFPSERDFVSSVRRDMKNIIANYVKVTNRIVAMSPEVMYESLKPVLQKAIYYCPKETGELRASAFLEIKQFRGSPRVEIGFGRGGKPFYAIYVHEAMDHYHEPPTSAKFLSRAIFEDMNRLKARLSAGYARLI